MGNKNSNSNSNVSWIIKYMHTFPLDTDEIVMAISIDEYTNTFMTTKNNLRTFQFSFNDFRPTFIFLWFIDYIPIC